VKNIFSSLAGASTEQLGGGAPAGFQFGEIKFPETKIGEITAKSGDWLAKTMANIETKPSALPPPSATVIPPKIPVPPPIRARIRVPAERN
jgi:hypothetical protein